MKNINTKRDQQIFWFDNLSLVLTTLCNSSQDGINLTIEKDDLTPGNNWGSANHEINKIWVENPIILIFNTTSPSLSFDLNTTIYGYHNTTTKSNRDYDEEKIRI